MDEPPRDEDAAADVAANGADDGADDDCCGRDTMAGDSSAESPGVGGAKSALTDSCTPEGTSCEDATAAAREEASPSVRAARGPLLVLVVSPEALKSIG